MVSGLASWLASWLPGWLASGRASWRASSSHRGPGAALEAGPPASLRGDVRPRVEGPHRLTGTPEEVLTAP